LDSWDPIEQEDIILQWAGRCGLAVLTKELVETYEWKLRYKLPC
jgi:hypothetical protein